MLAILGYILFALVAVVAIVLVVASRRPSDFRYARSRTIAAPVDRVFAEIVDLRRMNRWNPYALRESSGRADGGSAADSRREDLQRRQLFFLELFFFLAPARRRDFRALRGDAQARDLGVRPREEVDERALPRRRRRKESSQRQRERFFCCCGGEARRVCARLARRLLLFFQRGQRPPGQGRGRVRPRALLARRPG